MARIIAKTRIKRDYSKFMYFIKEGAVWQVPRKVKGKKKGTKKKLVQFGAKKMDYSKNIYFLDKNGNVAAAARKARKAKKKTAKKTTKKTAKKSKR